MAETTTSTNNKSVKFGIKPAREYVRGKHLPQRKRKLLNRLRSRGLISSAQHGGGS